MPCAATRSASACERAEVDAVVAQQAAGPDEDPWSRRSIASTPSPPIARKPSTLPEAELVLTRPGEDRGPERVLAPLLDRAGQVEQLVGRRRRAP